METPRSLLLMAGSAEAHALAGALRAEGARVRAVLPAPERSFGPLPVATDLLRLTSAGAAQDYIRQHGITAILDASHGFDAEISASVAAAAAEARLPYARVLRPEWTLPDGVCTAVDTAAAARLIRPGARVFAVTGRASVPAYVPFRGAVLFLRQTGAGGRDPLPGFVEVVAGQPPFTQDREAALFRELRIDTLICRNVGGAPSRPKLDAALELGLDVIVIRRPPPPPGHACVADVADALAWVRAL